MREDLIANLAKAQGYSESKGVFAARKAIMHETQRLGIKGVTVDDIILGNGVSELIVMAMQAPTTFTAAVTPEAKTANPAKTNPYGSAATNPSPCNAPTIDFANMGCANDTRDDNIVPTKIRTNARGSNRKILTRRRRRLFGGSARNVATGS